MRMRWRFSGHESLGTAAIKDQNSPWYGFKPVPRMMQNQLGHRLEFNLIDLDKKILKAVHNLMEKNDRGSWIVVTLAVFLLLHIRELDAGRNIFWSRHGDPVCPPSKFTIRHYSNSRSLNSGYTRRSQRHSLMKRLSLPIRYCRTSTVS
jgi:hypothetical protein